MGKSAPRYYEGEPGQILARVWFHIKRKSRKAYSRRIRKLIARHIRSSKSIADLSPRGRLLLRYLVNVTKDYCLVPLKAHSALPAKAIRLRDGEKFVSAAPRLPEGEGRRAMGDYPAIEARVLNDVIGSRSSSFLLSARKGYIPDFYLEQPDAIISDDRILIWHGNDGIGLLRIENEQRHQGGIMVFGAEDHNWYHWVIEILPAAFLAEYLPAEFSSLPLIVPAEIADLPTFRESLELFRGTRDVIRIGEGAHHFERLLTIDSLTREPMNMRNGQWPSERDYGFHRGGLLEYRATVLKRLGIEPVPQSEKLFLARGHGRRSYNQDELLKISEEMGFRGIFPERMSFREQVETFYRASHVVGPSGAAFANTLFCQPGTRLLSWLVPQYKGFCSFTNIAQVTGAELRYLFVTPDRPINTTGDAFRASYELEPAAYEAALAAMLES